MLMRRMVALRLLAVTSGVAKIVYRAFFVFDSVSVLWETIFVLVNIGQLLIIWYYEYHHRFADEERHFADNMPPGVDRSAIKRLLDLAELERHAGTGGAAPPLQQGNARQLTPGLPIGERDFSG